MMTHRNMPGKSHNATIELDNLRDFTYEKDGKGILNIIQKTQDPLVRESALKSFNKIYRSQKDVREVIKEYRKEYPEISTHFLRPIIGRWKKFPDVDSWNSLKSSYALLKIWSSNTRTDLFKMLDRYVDTWDPKSCGEKFNQWEPFIHQGGIFIDFHKSFDGLYYVYFYTVKISVTCWMEPQGDKVGYSAVWRYRNKRDLSQKHLMGMKLLFEDQMGLDLEEILYSALQPEDFQIPI